MVPTNNKYSFCIILFISLIDVSCNHQTSNYSNQERVALLQDEAKRISMDTSGIRVFFNTRIKARCNSDSCKKSVIRFEIVQNGKHYNIPIWRNLIDTNMIYDTYAFAADNSIVSTKAVEYIKAYSNKIIGLYNKIEVYDIRGGNPDLGNIVICKTMLNNTAVFAPDSSQIKHNYWKTFIRNASYSNNCWYFHFSK